MESNQQITFVAPSVEELSDMLPGYHIEKFIAQGGMGAVYLATQTSLDRQVAIKILPKVLGDDPTFREAFQVEAKLMAKLNHPNLISVYDFGDIEGMLYIIMEFAEGTTLHHLPFEQKLEHSYIAKVSAEIASGLFEAHEAGILHRDIKPSNILLNEKNHAKISDFGLARPHGETESGIIYGTPGYTAPEVLKNPAAVDVQADIFSVGVLIYELLTGKLPELAYVPVSSQIDADPDFDNIIRKATHPSPKMRYKSANALSEDLQKLEIKLENPTPVASNPLLTATNSTGGQTTSKVATKSTTSPVTQFKPKSGKKSLIINLIIICILSGACYFVYQSIQNKQAKAEEIIASNKVIEASTETAKKKAKVPSITPTKKRTSHAVALNQLKQQQANLSSGEFNPDDLPDNAFAKKSSYYLYIDEAMTWPQAQEFAKSYGAQLATCTSRVDVKFFRRHARENSKFWLGATTSVNHIEQIDGTSFPLNTPSLNDIGAVAYSESSGVLIEELLAKNPFFIQWRTKGEKPSSTPSQLLRVLSTLENSDVTYPPLTYASGSNHYYVLEQSMSWKKANDTARLVGGHLAVISDSDEAEALQKLLAKTLKPKTPCWLGSSKKSSGKWRNVTLEKGQHFKPLTGNGDALAIYYDGTTLKHRVINKKRQLPAFVIEWSPSEYESYKSRFSMNEIDQFDSLEKKTRSLYKLEQKKLKLVLKRSASRLSWALKTWLKNTTKSDQTNYKSLVSQIVSSVTHAKQIPEDLSLSGLPPSALRVANSCITYQNKIKRHHVEIVSLLTRSYQDKLQNFYRNESFKSAPRALKIAEALKEHKKDPKAIFKQ